MYYSAMLRLSGKWMLSSSFLPVSFALYLFFSLLLPFHQLQAQVTEEWAKRYNNSVTNGADIPDHLLTDKQGNVYVAGSGITIKYDPQGNLLWEKTGSALAIDGQGSVFLASSYTVKYDTQGKQLWVKNIIANDIAVDVQDNVYISAGDSIFKYTPQGNQVWMNTGGGNIELDRQGHVYVAGSTIVKYDASGNVLWSTSKQTGFNTNMTVDEKGNVYTAVAWVEIKDPYHCGCALEYYFYVSTSKIDSQGNSVWSRTEPAGGTIGSATSSLATDKQGNIYVGGYEVLLKYNPQGDLMWKNGIGGRITDLGVDEQGSVYATGYTDKEYDKVNGEYVTAKFTTHGEQIWSVRHTGDHRGGETGSLPMLALDEQGNVFIAGYSTDSTTKEDFLTIKYTQETISCTASGSILREYWANVPGMNIGGIPLHMAPDSVSQLSSFENTATQRDPYGERIRGYLCVPLSGNYTFYIAGDDQAELYLSTNEEPAYKIKIASVPSGTGVKEWTKYPVQQSAPVALKAGWKYYIEALHKEGTSSGHVSVGWQKPGDSTITVIPGVNLSPVVLPSVEVTSPAGNSSFNIDYIFTLTANATAADGSIVKIEFFNDTIKIGESKIEEGYSIKWSSPTAGTFRLTARAINNRGIAAVSTPLTVHITKPVASKEWDRTFGSTFDDFFGKIYDDYLSTVIQTKDKGYLLVGPSTYFREYDFFFPYIKVVKVDSNGVKQADRNIMRDDYTYLSAIVQGKDGGYFIGGTAVNEYGLPFYWLTKVGSNEVVRWDTTFSLELNQQYLYPSIKPLVAASDGGCLLIFPEGLVKLDSAGKKQWNTNIGSWSRMGIQTSDGGYLLGGKADSSSNGGTDYRILKIDNVGNKLWEKVFGGNASDLLSALLETTDGGYLLGGSSNSGISGDKSQDYHHNATDTLAYQDYWVVKINNNGVKQWDKTFGGNADDKLSSIVLTQDGNYLLGGSSVSTIDGDRTDFSRGSADFWVVKINTDGTKLWDRAYGGSSDDNLASVVQAADGGFALGGSSQSGISGEKSEASLGGWDFWIVKTFPEQISLPPALQINFQDKHTKTPAGWLKDYGLAFSEKAYGDTTYSFGWKQSSDGMPVDLSPGGTFPGNGRWRPTPADPLLATLMHMQGDDVKNFRGNPTQAYWELAVENGAYQVTVSVGDGTKYTGTDLESHSINIEGKPLITHFIPQGSSGSLTRFKQSTLTVTVSDGLLTIDADGGVNTKINYAIIQPLSYSPSVATTRRAVPEEPAFNPQLLVYPNPFLHTLRIGSTLVGKIQIQLFDAMGNTYYQATHQTDTGEILLDFSNLPMKAGMYLLKLQAEDGSSQIRKVLKK